MGFYEDAAEAALAALEEYGTDVTLKTFTEGAYSGGAVAITPVSTTRKGAIFDFASPNSGNGLQDNSLIRVGDKWMLMDVNGATPTTTDHIVFGSTEYTIVNVKTMEPGGVEVIHELHLRK